MEGKEKKPCNTRDENAIKNYVKLGYDYLHACMPLVIFAFVLALASSSTLLQLWANLPYKLLLSIISAFFVILYIYTLHRHCPIFLLDFACFKPSDEFKVSRQIFLTHSKETGKFLDKSLEFQQKILERSGLGEDTYFPKAVLARPPNPNMGSARDEAYMVIIGAMDELFLKLGITSPFQEVDILILNCSLFNPNPSLSSMVVNHYKLRSDVLSYNLGGMGCSAGVIAVGLARDLLRTHPNKNAVVVSTENISLNWYMGNQRSMLLPNCIFRMGGVAIMLSNKVRERWRAKYELKHVVRTHRGADDVSFKCVNQEEDSDQIVGLSLMRELMAVAGGALKVNITTLAPRVLPISEKLRFVLNLAYHYTIKHLQKTGDVATMAPTYVPNFTKAFEHFCIHAGGRAVLDELEKSLQLAPHLLEPSRMTLYRFGNTSSSSLWYELAYLEAKGRVHKGHRVWQIAFGSGFKCNSAVWRALRNFDTPVSHNPWLDIIQTYPLHVA